MLESPVEARIQTLYGKVNNPFAQLQRKYRTIPDIVASQILVENSDFRKKSPAKKFKTLYSNHFLKPLLQVCAVAAKGQHSLSTSGMPQLVILCLDEPTYNFIEDNGLSKGSYIRHGNLVSIKLPNDFQFDSVISTIIHELTHFAVYEVFKNMSRPYNKEDEASRHWCENAVRATQMRIKEWNWDNALDTEENRSFFKLLQQVFENYSSEDIHSEMIVRVPQIASLKNENRAWDWLQQFPELLHFYLDHVIPAFNTYLESYKTQLPQLEKGFKKTEKARRNFIAKLNLNPVIA